MIGFTPCGGLLGSVLSYIALRGLSAASLQVVPYPGRGGVRSPGPRAARERSPGSVTSERTPELKVACVP